MIKLGPVFFFPCFFFFVLSGKGFKLKRSESDEFSSSNRVLMDRVLRRASSVLERHG